MNEQTLSVTGMTCTDCAHHVEKALMTVLEIAGVEVAYPQGVVHIRSAHLLSLERLNAALPMNYRLSTPSVQSVHLAPVTSSVFGQTLGAVGGLLKSRAGSTAPLRADEGPCGWP